MAVLGSLSNDPIPGLDGPVIRWVVAGAAGMIALATTTLVIAVVDGARPRLLRAVSSLVAAGLIGAGLGWLLALLRPW
ncbi:MAG: hypothetical protein PGN07_05870 [Aeromicrobium erythreum]